MNKATLKAVAFGSGVLSVIYARKLQVEKHPTLIIGGGVLGLSAANAIHSKGYPVQVLDAGSGGSMGGDRIVSLTRYNGLADYSELELSQKLLRTQQNDSKSNFYRETGTILIRKSDELTQKFPERMIRIPEAKINDFGVNPERFKGQCFILDKQGGTLDLGSYMNDIKCKLPLGTIKNCTVTSVIKTGLFENLITGATFKVQTDENSTLYATNIIECMGVGGIELANKNGIKMTVNLQCATYIPVEAIRNRLGKLEMPVSGTTNDGTHFYFFPPDAENQIRMGSFQTGPAPEGIIIGNSLDDTLCKVEEGFQEKSIKRAIYTFNTVCSTIKSSREQEASAYVCPISMVRNNNKSIYSGTVIVCEDSYLSKIALGGRRVSQFGCSGNGAKYGPANGLGLANFVLSGVQSDYMMLYSKQKYLSSQS
jgi:glycine/D-amino acid oxidase-like deaminating enzyme